MSFSAQQFPQDARSVAILVLHNVAQGISLQEALDSALVKNELSSTESRLCTQLVYGYSRYAFRIEYILKTLLKKPNKLPPIFLINLGISCYALLFLTKVPNYATVNWAVHFTKQRFGLALSKLCNGVLRSLLRLGDAPHFISFYKDAHAFYSVPKWIYDLFINQYGIENANLILMRSLNKPTPCLRLNSTHSLYHSVKQEFLSLDFVSPLAFDGFVCKNDSFDQPFSNFNLNDLHDNGVFSWQAAGSQVALHQCFLAVPELFNEQWWDACAGQGGKSLALMEQNVKVSLVSDTSKKRLNQFIKNCLRLQISPPRLVQMNASSIALKRFNCSVVIDVPCSGLGTLARRPDIRFHRKLSDLKNLILIQQKILKSAFDFILQNRFLIYMTCTLNPHENEVLIDNFLKNNHAQLVFSWQTPHDHPYLEGMYACVLKKI